MASDDADADADADAAAADDADEFGSDWSGGGSEIEGGSDEDESVAHCLVAIDGMPSCASKVRIATANICSSVPYSEKTRMTRLMTTIFLDFLPGGSESGGDERQNKY